jgi:hypothetical protein
MATKGRTSGINTQNERIKSLYLLPVPASVSTPLANNPEFSGQRDSSDTCERS